MVVFARLGFVFCLLMAFSMPAQAQISTNNSGGSTSAGSANTSGPLCRPHFVEGFDLEAELESLERPAMDNVLKLFSGMLYLDAYIVDCSPPNLQRLEDDRQPTSTPQQEPKRKCFDTPDGQTVCYTIKNPKEVELEYCDENGNCKTITIKKNNDGSMTITNPNATIEMECTLDNLGRTQCKVKSVSVTGGWLVKRLYNDLMKMIESITTGTDPNRNKVQLCLTKDNGETVCYTVTPNEIEMCVDGDDGSTTCISQPPEQDITDLIDWMIGRNPGQSQQ